MEIDDPFKLLIAIAAGVVILVMVFYMIPQIGESTQSVADTITDDTFSIIFSGNISEGDTFTVQYEGGTAETYEFSYNGTYTAGNIQIT